MDRFREYLTQCENDAVIHGWDFSHIDGKYRSYDELLGWDYEEEIRKYLAGGHIILDMDTGGGEFLMKLSHPYENTYVTENYPPNVKICREKLESLGIKVYECDYDNMPFEENKFDIVLNRHGSYNPKEVFRILKPGGVFITQQVGEYNERELVEFLLGDIPKPFPGMNLAVQEAAFIDAGFHILRAEEAFVPIEFYDIGALVWFAKIISWEFAGFSVQRCFYNLVKAEKCIIENGKISGNIHRYLLICRKQA